MHRSIRGVLAVAAATTPVQHHDHGGGTATPIQHLVVIFQET